MDINEIQKIKLETRPRPASSQLMALTRRELLKRSLAVTGGFAFGGTFLAASDAAWAMELKALSPESMATLTQMARDIYPHDSFGDELYAAAVKGHDESAANDAEFKTMIEEGVAMLDEKAKEGGNDSYIGTGWESDRNAILRGIEDTDFFNAIRGGLVVGLYNQPAVWEKLGYEGPSFDKGGYLYRGFDDISWL